MTTGSTFNLSYFTAQAVVGMTQLLKSGGTSRATLISCSTFIFLEVHYESYAKKGSRKRMPYPRCCYKLFFQRNIAHLMSGYRMTLSRCVAVCPTTPSSVKDAGKAQLSGMAGDMRHYIQYPCVDGFFHKHGHKPIVIDRILYPEMGKKDCPEQRTIGLSLTHSMTRDSHQVIRPLLK